MRANAWRCWKAELTRYAAYCKTVAAEIAVLGVDITGPGIQVATVGSGAGRTRPPVAIRRTFVDIAVGTVVVAGTQERGTPELLPGHTAAQLENYFNENLLRTR